MSFCTSLFSILPQRAPVLMMAVGLTATTNYVSNNPGPGDRYGTAQMLVQTEQKLIAERSELRSNYNLLQANFDKFVDPKPTEEQVKYILRTTDACTDHNVRDVLSDRNETRTVAWILYSDTYSKSGIQEADKLFKK